MNNAGIQIKSTVSVRVWFMLCGSVQPLQMAEVYLLLQQNYCNRNSYMAKLHEM